MIKLNANIEKYYDDSQQLHKVDGPAVIYRCSYGSYARSESWYIHGKRHRDNGPAYITYDFDDNPLYTNWFIDGIDISKEVIEWLSRENISYPFTKDEQILFKLKFA